MLRFCGFDLELFVEKVVTRSDWPTICQARDASGIRWLIVQVGEAAKNPAWLCAPVSERAIKAVLQGRASPIDAVRHSATGTVELVALDNGRAVPDRCVLCSQVNELVVGFQSQRTTLAA
jgi:hypothetical protein